MITFTLRQAADAMNAVLRGADETMSFTGVTTDSRKAKPGVLYVPIVGARADGHDFSKSALEKGAAASLWQADHTPYPDDIPLLIVEDPVEAMGKLAAAWIEANSFQIVGITGSNGKTSTKDLLASVFSTKYKTWKTLGNHNNEIGLPLTVFETDADTEILILEMGMENLGEIAYLCSIAPLDGAIITSIGSAHLENLGSMDNIARAKCEIVTSLKPGGTLVYNQESEHLLKALDEISLDPSWKLIPYGKGTQYCPQDLQFSRRGLSFVLPALSKKPFHVRAASSVQAWNATGAILMARSMGMSLEQCEKGTETAELTPMRGQLLPWKQAIILDDTYKSNPEAAAQALRTLMKIPAKIHIAVLADMLDLGENELALHAQTGELASSLGVDILMTYGDRSQKTSQAFEGTSFHFENKEDLAKALQPWKDQDAAILIKGSRAMGMDTIVKDCLEGKE